MRTDGMYQYPESEITQSDDRTCTRISTWVELADPPNGTRIQVELDLTWDGVEFGEETVTSRSGFSAVVPTAMKLQNPRILRAESIGFEMKS